MVLHNESPFWDTDLLQPGSDGVPGCPDWRYFNCFSLSYEVISSITRHNLLPPQEYILKELQRDHHIGYTLCTAACHTNITSGSYKETLGNGHLTGIIAMNCDGFRSLCFTCRTADEFLIGPVGLSILPNGADDRIVLPEYLIQILPSK